MSSGCCPCGRTASRAADKAGETLAAGAEIAGRSLEAGANAAAQTLNAAGELVERVRDRGESAASSFCLQAKEAATRLRLQRMLIEAGSRGTKRTNVERLELRLAARLTARQLHRYQARGRAVSQPVTPVEAGRRSAKLGRKMLSTDSLSAGSSPGSSPASPAKLASIVAAAKAKAEAGEPPKDAGAAVAGDANGDAAGTDAAELLESADQPLAAAAAAEAQMCGAAAEVFVGKWVNTSTTGLEPYLKFMGMSWAMRKVAAGFKPKVVWSIEGGVLTTTMPSPVGERVEHFTAAPRLDKPDPNGGEFNVSSAWEGEALVTTARDVQGVKSDFVTRRFVLDGGAMVQQTSHANVAFERIFVREFADNQKV